MAKVKVHWQPEKITAYTQDDLSRFQPIIEKAKALWRAKTREYVSKNGDVGSCVLGAGIYAYVLSPQSTEPKDIMIIRANEIACAQGSITWEHSKDEVMEFLKQNGIETGYEWGFMD